MNVKKPVGPCPVCNRDFRSEGGLQKHLSSVQDPEHAAHRDANSIAQPPERGPHVYKQPDDGSWPAERKRLAAMEEAMRAARHEAQDDIQNNRDVEDEVTSPGNGMRIGSEPAASASVTSSSKQSSAETSYKNSDLINLEDPIQGEVILGFLCQLLSKGTPFGTACARLRIDIRSLERTRRLETGWGRHVNNTVNMAEAEWEQTLVKGLLDSTDNVSVKKAETYIAAFKPKFAASHKLRLEYELNGMLAFVKRLVSDEQWLAICDDAAAFDVRILQNVLDGELLPKKGQ